MASLAFAAFCMGVGISLPSNALLSGIGVYSMIFGRSSFFILTVALYTAGLPVAVMQVARADRERQHCNSKSQMWCDARRVILALLISAVLLLFVAPEINSVATLAGVAAGLGILSVIAMGYSFQIVLSQSPRSCGDGNSSECNSSRVGLGSGKSSSKGNTASLSFGYQASSIVCFCAQMWTGFLPNVMAAGSARHYFSIASFFTLLVILAVVYFVRFSDAQPAVPVNESHEQRIQAHPPSSFSERQAQVPLLSDDSGASSVQYSSVNGTGRATPVQAQEDPEEQVLEGQPQPSFDLKPIVFEPAVGLFLAIFASMLLFPFYSYVPSAKGTMSASATLATNLFYVKTFSDTLARPSTVFLPRRLTITSPRTLVIVSSMRLLAFLPLFFLYTYTNIIPKNDVAFLVAAGLFAAGSGYLKTIAYQLLPEEGLRVQHKRQINSIMNLTFHSAFACAISLALLLWQLLPNQ